LAKILRFLLKPYTASFEKIDQNIGFSEKRQFLDENWK
jgi:hypothetical protein